MSSTCFEHEGSSSGRRLYIQERYGIMFNMHQYKQFLGRRICSKIKNWNTNIEQDIIWLLMFK
jgi:hypothetical protein